MITHGLPKHNCFSIVLPTSKVQPTLDELQVDYKPPVQEFEDPKSGEKFHGEILKIATLTLAEFESQSILSYMCYGLPPDKLIPELRRKYPEINRTQTLRFVLIRKI